MVGGGFLTGNRVYSSGSFAPHRGQVTAKGAQGYLRRTLAQRAKKQAFNGVEGRRVGAMRIGRDGKSDTRSGVAASAMQRSANVNIMAGDHKPTPINPGAPAPSPAPGSGNKTPGQTPGINPGRDNSGTGGGTQVPSVTINDKGQIELPYDANYSDELYNNLADFNNQLMELQLGSQQQAAQYAQGLRDENLNFGQAKISDLNRNAGAGMAFSSRYATDVGRTYGDHQNSINDLNAANSLYGQQVAAQRAAIQDNFNQQLQAAAQQRQRDLYDQAGTLGYGKAKAQPPKKDNKPNKSKGNGGNNKPHQRRVKTHAKQVLKPVRKHPKPPKKKAGNK